MIRNNYLTTAMVVPVNRVRHPDGRLLRTDGERVPLSTYWRRRLAAGDVRRIDAGPVLPVETIEPKAPRRKRAPKAAAEPGTPTEPVTDTPAAAGAEGETNHA